MTNPKKYLNHLDYVPTAVGNERRYEMLQDILKKGTFVPRAVEYKDIDSAFREWVESELKISYNDKILPTMVLYSNQRFTEYTQTWQYTDDNKNLILNFKTITRENNPSYGNIQGGLWNIPGERFYLMKRTIVLDDNGSESFLDLKMKQPMAIDLTYTVSIFTTNYETINEFNMLVNDKFKARQAYIAPNSHFMPMTLENISDKSSYQIEDRQFYSQSFDIKVNAYIIREGDFRMEEVPLKRGVRFAGGILKKKSADIEVEEYDNPCNAPKDEQRFYKKPVTLIIKFPECVKSTEFQLDIDFTMIGMTGKNVRRFNVQVDDNDVEWENLTIKEGETIKIEIVRKKSGEGSILYIYGYDPRVSFDTDKDEPEIEADNEQLPEEYIVVV